MRSLLSVSFKYLGNISCIFLWHILGSKLHAKTRLIEKKSKQKIPFCLILQVFVKKEEMIRHFKWHKKRDESLQHGFMRYSPMDDCAKKFGTCTHNGRQTHYHCLQVRVTTTHSYIKIGKNHYFGKLNFNNNQQMKEYIISSLSAAKWYWMVNHHEP